MFKLWCKWGITRIGSYTKILFITCNYLSYYTLSDVTLSHTLACKRIHQDHTLD